MSRLKKVVLNVVLVLIVVLTGMSVYGAFIGAERAREFFNSVWLGAFFLFFILLLAAGFMIYRRLRQKVDLLLMHLGCVLVLAGSMWGSVDGHKLQERFLGVEKFQSGRMLIYENTSSNQVVVNDNEGAELPFSVRLKDFRLEYYDPGTVYIHDESGESWEISAVEGKEYFLREGPGVISVEKVFENFKIYIQQGKSVIHDDPESGSNPAVELQITDGDGSIRTRYVFEHFPGHSDAQDKYQYRYHRDISDYISDLDFEIDGEPVASASLEVNHPFHFSGYHFYQNSYDDQDGRYTVLGVTSDTGLVMVYAGYLMLGVGVFWCFWIRQSLGKRQSRDSYGN